jgi:hypothetical protein
LEAPQTKANSVGALVDQLLGQVEPGLSSSLPTTNRTVNFVSQTSLNINGKSYKNLDEVPAELRQAINQGLAMTNQLGMFARSVESQPVVVTTNSEIVDTPTKDAQNRRRVIVSLIVLALIVATTFVVILLLPGP